MRLRKRPTSIPDAIETQTRPIGTYEAIAGCGAFFDLPLQVGARRKASLRLHIRRPLVSANELEFGTAVNLQAAAGPARMRIEVRKRFSPFSRGSLLPLAPRRCAETLCQPSRRSKRIRLPD
jgi:hypothetical protein